MYVAHQNPSPLGSDLGAILRRGRCPDLTERARVFVAPILHGTGDRGVALGADAAPSAPVPGAKLAAAIAEATGKAVGDVIVLPDDASLPSVKKMAGQGVLAPKLRLGELLHRQHGKALTALAEDIRRGLRENLSRLYSLHDQAAAFTQGFEYAVRVSRRDALFYFLSAAIIGDERRCRALAGIVACMRMAVPLAIVNERAGIWLAHRT